MPRNASGVYTLPASNPVVSGTLIESTWANDTMADLADDMTDSLDRNGRGSMLAAFKSTDGTVGLPGITFSNELTTGLYREAAGQLSASILGVKRLGLTAAGMTVIGNTILGIAGATLNVGAGAFTVAATGAGNFTTSGLTASLTLTDTGGSGAGLQFVGSGGVTPKKFIRVQSGRMEFVNDGYSSVITSITDDGRMAIGNTTPRAGMTLDLLAGSLGGVGNIGGTSDTGAYTIWAGLSSVNGAYLQLYASGHATNANQLLIGTASTTRILVNASGHVNIGASSATYQAQVSGAGQVVAAMTDAGAKGASLFLSDTASGGAGQGGALLFGAFNITTPMCGIKGFITDAANNSRGDLVFLTRRVATDAFLTETMRISAVAGTITDKDSLELGYKGTPPSSITTGAFSTADRGKMINASGGVTVPNSTMAAGDVVSIYNNTAGSITITATVGTLRLAGTTTTGNRAIAARGLATVYFISATEAIISGAGVS